MASYIRGIRNWMLKKNQIAYNNLYLDFQTLSSEELENFMIALENLKQTIQNKLDSASQPGKNLA